MTKKIKKAVIPAAGLGTRFLPATKAIPKEMIPILDVPMIQYIVEEAVRSGIEDIVLVTARNKDAIENHFDVHFELEENLRRKEKTALLKLCESTSSLCRLISVRQKNPLGLGHAVLTAAQVIGNEPFAVLLGDDLIDSDKPCTQQLVEVYQKHATSVVGVMEVEPEEVSKYGIIEETEIAPRTHKVSGVVEKPSPQEAPSRYAIPGRYILSPEIFPILEKTPPGKGGEIQLTDALAVLAKRDGLIAYQFEGTRFDTGDRLGYLDATLEFSLRRPDLKEDLIKIMKKHLKKNEGN